MDEQKIIDLYVNTDVSITRLAKQLNVTQKFIGDILRKNNIKIKPQVYHKNEVRYIDESTFFTKEQKENLNIKEISLDKKEWINVTINDFEIANIGVSKKLCSTGILFNNKKYIYVKYECKKCNQLIQTIFIKLLKRNRPICRTCAMGLDEVKNKVSKQTKIAMHKPEIAKKHSLAQKKRFAKPEEKEKSHKRALEIISRPGMKEKISISTKKSMKEVEKRKDFQTNNILAKQKINRNKKTIPQQTVENFIRNELKINCVDEYAINLYNDNSIDRKYMLIDIAIPEYMIAIEVLGDFFHECFIDYFFNKIDIENTKKKYNSIPLKNLKSDIKKHEYFISNNWKILYITETEIKKTNWKDKIKQFLVREGVILG